MSEARLRAHVLESLDHPAITPDRWAELLAAGDTDTVFLTLPWQQAWWNTFGRGQLMLIAVEEGERTVALAPFFADSGMVFFVGSGGSDYLDFIGDVGDPDVLALLLDTARQYVPNFLGFRLYHVPNSSNTGERLKTVAQRLRLDCHNEGGMVAPRLDLTEPEAGISAANKKSLRRHERWFRREGDLRVRHACTGHAIRPHLDAFFQQHVARWKETPYPSLFNDPTQRRFYERLVETNGDVSWLRFTWLEWEERPIAFHFGTCYKGNFLWYKPTFDTALAKRSPGEVLIRHLLFAAVEEGAHTFDLGLGDEAFKERFATHNEQVHTWGLYPEKEVDT